MAQNTGYGGGSPDPDLRDITVDTKSAMRKPRFSSPMPKRPRRDDFDDAAEYQDAIRKWSAFRPSAKSQGGALRAPAATKQGG